MFLQDERQPDESIAIRICRTLKTHSSHDPMRSPQGLDTIPVILLLPLQAVDIHERVHTPGVPLDPDLDPALPQLLRVRLPLVPQGVHLPRAHKGLAQALKVGGPHGLDPPLGPQRLDLVGPVGREALEAEPVDARPGQDGPVVELDEGTVGRVGVVPVGQGVGGGRHGGHGQAQGDTRVAGQVLEDDGDVSACGDAAYGDGLRVDVEE